MWSDNDAAYQKFDIGTLDAEIYDLNGNVVQDARIKLPSSIRQRVLELDKLYAESLNWEDTGEQSLWDKNQWEYFYNQATGLHKQISLTLGNDFEVVYKQA